MGFTMHPVHLCCKAGDMVSEQARGQGTPRPPSRRAPLPPPHGRALVLLLPRRRSGSASLRAPRRRHVDGRPLLHHVRPPGRGVQRHHHAVLLLRRRRSPRRPRPRAVPLQDPRPRRRHRGQRVRQARLRPGGVHAREDARRRRGLHFRLRRPGGAAVGVAFAVRRRGHAVLHAGAQPGRSPAGACRLRVTDSPFPLDPPEDMQRPGAVAERVDMRGHAQAWRGGVVRVTGGARSTATGIWAMQASPALCFQTLENLTTSNTLSFTATA